jgi:dinuclear metal center YbgI/SA1388 family protein
MAILKDLVEYTNTLLGVAGFRDYCPNGLQVEGRQEVQRLVSGVTASMALIEAAIEVRADALLVHHGYFWKGEDACITGMKQRRLRRLLGADISLLAYHLPLDAHSRLGNNAQLAHILGLEPDGVFGSEPDLQLGQYGHLSPALDGEALAAHIAQRLGRVPQHIPGAAERIETIGWCTGAAQSWIEAAAARGLHAFISGEISEQTVHVARETGIHYFAAGHHATERYGVQALGAHLAEYFELTHEFVDIGNPV